MRQEVKPASGIWPWEMTPVHTSEIQEKMQAQQENYWRAVTPGLGKYHFPIYNLTAGNLGCQMWDALCLISQHVAQIALNTCRADTDSCYHVTAPILLGCLNKLPKISLHRLSKSKKVYNDEIQISHWHTYPAFLLPLLYFNILENVRTVLKKIGKLMNLINETWLQ